MQKFLFTLIHKGKGKGRRGKRETGKAQDGEHVPDSTLHPDRTHALPNETKRTAFPLGLTPPPPLPPTPFRKNVTRGGRGGGGLMGGQGFVREVPPWSPGILVR